MSVRGEEAGEPAASGHSAEGVESPTPEPRPLVEILYFDGCPHHEQTTSWVERVAAELGLRPEIRLVRVADAEAAARQRFLGSPTVRVNGEDVEPGAEKRGDYVLSCRVFTTERGVSGQPEERWIRDALMRSAGST